MNPKLQSDLLDRINTSEHYPSDSQNGARSALTEEGSSSIADSLMTLWCERRFIVKAFGAGLLLAAVLSLIIPPKYEATTRIMPPQSQGLGGLAAMIAAAGEEHAGPLLGGIVSDAIGIKSSGALYTGVLKSSTVLDKLIGRFNLRQVYHVKYEKDARERLTNNTEISEDRKSGIISVTVTDQSRQRATDLANAYIEDLNSLTAQLNTSAAHRERLFIEDRLKTAKQDLDAASNDLSDFSGKNLTLDVKEQGKAMLMGTASLTGELIAAESQLSGLEQIYAPNNFRVRSLQARIAELRQKLSELRGTGVGEADQTAPKTAELGPSIAELPSLGVKYYDLYRKAKIQETVFEILTKQYELAKIEEAKELPTIKVLDVAQVPETKSSPKRILITIVGAMLATILAGTYVMISARLRSLSGSHPLSLLRLEMSEGLARDFAFLYSHAPLPVRRMFLRSRHQMSGGAVGCDATKTSR